MKVLSIKQPWLYAITNLDKRIENRVWKPPWWIIGERIALHASKQDDPYGYAGVARISNSDVPQDKVIRGAIVATAIVRGYYDEFYNFTGTPTAVDLAWFVGPYGWVLDDVKLLDESIAISGRLGLWEYPHKDENRL